MYYEYEKKTMTASPEDAKIERANNGYHMVIIERGSARQATTRARGTGNDRAPHDDVGAGRYEGAGRGAPIPEGDAPSADRSVRGPAPNGNEQGGRGDAYRIQLQGSM
jgi:hypothetical protein